MKKYDNRTTGPTNFPPEVYEAINRPIISHRDSTFKNILDNTSNLMQKLLNTHITPMFFSASGTGGLEGIILNTLTKNSQVLSLSNGYYGDLWGRITQKHLNIPVVAEKFPPGKSICLERVRHILKKNTFDAILITHSESSTGVLNDLSAITKTIKEHSDALILVDAISSIGCTPCYMNDWNIDVLITVSQKGLMSPPGLNIVFANEKSINQSRKKEVIGSFYFDFSQTLEAQKLKQVPFTPNILAIIGLEASLKKIEKEGFSKTFQRHRDISQICHKVILELGLELFAESNIRGTGITAILLPEFLLASQTQLELKTDFGLCVTTGLDWWSERVIRIGHMGYISKNDIYQTLNTFSNWFHLRGKI